MDSEIQPAVAVVNNVEAKTEGLIGKHFGYTLVFGQGPVQEADKVPTTGREGLNFYSRQVALAAATMLEHGITDKVILSGGKTGARQSEPEGKTEAELMADVIRRHLTKVSEDGKFYNANGISVPMYETNVKGTPNITQRRAQSDIDKDIQTAYKDILLIENESKDTFENFKFIRQKYLQHNTQEPVALLGISFHAYDTWSEAGRGRLEVLADLFGLNASVFAAEGVLRELPGKMRRDTDGTFANRSQDSFVHKQLDRLTEESITHEVSRLKSQQEAKLVEMTQSSNLTRVYEILDSGESLRAILSRNADVQRILIQKLNMTVKQIQNLELSALLDKIRGLKDQDELEYGRIKTSVFQGLERMSQEQGINYYEKYAKGEIQKQPKTA